jgi:citrate/tricarballylate utilization protein
VLAVAVGGGLSGARAGSFYAVFPHGLLVSIFGIAFVFAILAMTIGASRFRAAIASEQGSGGGSALGAAMTLANLKGGGEGCYVRAGFDHPPEVTRRWFHHLTVYGFLLCFASTALGTFYHYALKAPAPYAFTHPVVVLGTLGGIGLLIGPAGLIWLKRRHDRELLDASQSGLDRGFTWLLFATSATGLALMVWRDTGAMPFLLALHLGVVLALFLTLPYGKFVHGLYRYLALARSSRGR